MVWWAPWRRGPVCRGRAEGPRPGQERYMYEVWTTFTIWYHPLACVARRTSSEEHATRGPGLGFVDQCRPPCLFFLLPDRRRTASPSASAPGLSCQSGRRRRAVGVPLPLRETGRPRQRSITWGNPVPRPPIRYSAGMAKETWIGWAAMRPGRCSRMTALAIAGSRTPVVVTPLPPPSGPVSGP